MSETITDVLHLTRPLIVLDLETTGLSVENDRIIEIGFQVHAPDSEVKEWRSLINPGMPIPPLATKIHGITDEDMLGCRKCGVPSERHPPDLHGCDAFTPIPRFEQVSAKLAKGFTEVDFAGKNVRFDLSFLAAAMRRAYIAWTYIGAYILDAEQLERLANPRHLSDLYKKYTGEDHLDAHSALDDVRATTRVIEGQLQTYQSLPRDLRRLHELSWPGWVDTEGKVRLEQGIPVLTFGKHRGKPLADVPREYWQDFVLKSDFSREFKAIATDALAGRFPR